jgi:SAM-dependent methyltransferase
MPDPAIPNRDPAAPARRPLTVWPVNQLPARLQRADRYLPGSTAHPGKMLPALARHIIATYSQPGDVVLDPMCGIGTSLIEAAHLGRHAVGVDTEPRWITLARANARHAAAQGATGTIRLAQGDSRHLHRLLPPDLAGQVRLLLTSPPYGPATHGQVTPRPGDRVHKSDYTYGPSPANLARAALPALTAGFADILTAARPYLHPDALVAVSVRPYRLAGDLIDLPGAILTAAHTAGYQRADRAAALLTGLRGSRLVGRTTFFALHNIRAARAAAIPLHATAHEDILLLRVDGEHDGPRQEHP